MNISKIQSVRILILNPKKDMWFENMSSDNFEADEKSNKLGPVETTIGILSGKWKPLIIYHLKSGQGKRFSTLMDLIPSISKRMLSKSLDELHDDLIVNRVEIAENHVKYYITELGLSLTDVLDKIVQWGFYYLNTKYDLNESQIMYPEDGVS